MFPRLGLPMVKCDATTVANNLKERLNTEFENNR